MKLNCFFFRYLLQEHASQYELTDGEILAGIDGILMGEQIKQWTQHNSRIRLSQILDMYYSVRGIRVRAFEEIEKKINDKGISHISIYDGITRACDRIKILRAIDNEKLRNQTYYVAQILQYVASGVTVNDGMLRKHCEAAVNRFFDYACTSSLNS